MLRAKRPGSPNQESRVSRDPAARAVLSSVWRRTIPAVVSTISLQRLAGDRPLLFREIASLAQAASTHGLCPRTRVTYNSQVVKTPRF